MALRHDHRYGLFIINYKNSAKPLILVTNRSQSAAALLGVGVASTRPISGRDARVLRNPNMRAIVDGREWVSHDKGMLSCSIDVDNVAFKVCSLHLFPFHEFGIGENDTRVDRMWKEFWDYADLWADNGELILAGDFNHRTRALAARRWSRTDWYFCLGEQGTTSRGLPLDEIAVSSEPSASATQVVPTFSDHHLILAELGCPLPAGAPLAREVKIGRAVAS